MRAQDALTPAPARTGNGRHEDLRCGSHSSFSATIPSDQCFFRSGFFLEDADRVARLFAVIFAVALCEDVPAVDYGAQHACSWLRAASRTLGKWRALAAREAAR